jgi:Ca-activated chloride channel family protein
VLLDTSRPQDARTLPESATISRLQLRFPDGTPPVANVDPALAVWIFVDDPVSPRARVRVVDLLRQGLERPLNLSRGVGQLLRIVLVDPKGAWAQQTPQIELSLAW